jgi:hypothetical protein
LQNQLNLARAISFEIEKQTVQEELVETGARLQLAFKQLAVASEHRELTKQDIDGHSKILIFKASILLSRLIRRYPSSKFFAAQDTIEFDGQQISGKRSITVDKVVTALAILVFGYMIAVRLARLIERMMVTRFAMDASLARIARRWILFIEVRILVVVSVLVARIPLPIFAFMGCAGCLSAQVSVCRTCSRI